MRYYPHHFTVRYLSERGVEHCVCYLIRNRADFIYGKQYLAGRTDLYLRKHSTSQMERVDCEISFPCGMKSRGESVRREWPKYGTPAFIRICPPDSDPLRV